MSQHRKLGKLQQRMVIFLAERGRYVSGSAVPAVGPHASASQKVIDSLVARGLVRRNSPGRFSLTAQGCRCVGLVAEGRYEVTDVWGVGA